MNKWSDDLKSDHWSRSVFFSFLSRCALKIRSKSFCFSYSFLWFLMNSKWLRLRVIKFKISSAQKFVTVLRIRFEFCMHWVHQTRASNMIQKEKNNNKFIASKPNNLLIKRKSQPSKKKYVDHFDLMVNFGFNYE